MVSKNHSSSTKHRPYIWMPRVKRTQNIYPFFPGLGGAHHIMLLWFCCQRVPRNGSSDAQSSDVATETKEAMLIQVESSSKNDHRKEDITKHLIAERCLGEKNMAVSACREKITHGAVDLGTKQFSWQGSFTMLYQQPIALFMSIPIKYLSSWLKNLYPSQTKTNTLPKTTVACHWKNRPKVSRCPC